MKTYEVSKDDIGKPRRWQGAAVMASNLAAGLGITRATASSAPYGGVTRW